MEKVIGYEAGDICNRNGCVGHICETAHEGCSCHISAPCSNCVEDRRHCDACDWNGRDERYSYEKKQSEPYCPAAQLWKSPDECYKEMDGSKIDWISIGHTNFSMIKKGKYPEGTPIEEIRKLVNGTFGGRFNYCSNGKFEFVAYTD
jgi:hypothetical protein